jgi:hypothetical protein
MAGPQYVYGAMPIYFWRSLRTASVLPKLVSQRGDFLLVGWVSAMPGPGSLMLRLGVQVCLIGVLQRLSGTFVSGQVILLSVALGAGTMGVCGIATVFSGYLL